MLKLQIAIAFLLQFLLEDTLDFLDFLIVVALDLPHRLLVLILLLDLLLLQVKVALLKILDVFIFLLAGCLLLVAVTLLVLEELSLYASLGRIQLCLELTLLREPVLHLGFLYEHNVGQLRAHYALLVWISFVLIELVDPVRLLDCNRSNLLFGQNLTCLEILLLFNVVHE